MKKLRVNDVVILDATSGFYFFRKNYFDMGPILGVIKPIGGIGAEWILIRHVTKDENSDYDFFHHKRAVIENLGQL